MKRRRRHERTKPPGEQNVERTEGATVRLALTNDASAFSGNGVIGGQAFYDSNNDGMRDAGTHGADGVDGIDVWLCSCYPIRSLGHYRTPSTGIYRFVDLAPGDYFILVQPPAGYQFSSDGKIYILENTVPETGRTVCFHLEEGERAMHWSFGLHKLTHRPSLEPSASAHISNDLSFGLHKPTGWPTFQPSATAHSSNSSPPSVAFGAVAPAPESSGGIGIRTRNPTPRPSRFPIPSPTHMPLRAPSYESPNVARSPWPGNEHELPRKNSDMTRDKVGAMNLSSSPVDSPSPSIGPTLSSVFLAMIAISAALFVRKYQRRRKNGIDIDRNVDAEAPARMRTFTNSSDSFGESESVGLSNFLLTCPPIMKKSLLANSWSEIESFSSEDKEKRSLSLSSLFSHSDVDVAKDGDGCSLSNSYVSLLRLMQVSAKISDSLEVEFSKSMPELQQRLTLKRDACSILEKEEILHCSEQFMQISTKLTGLLEEEFSRSTPELQRRLSDGAERERHPLKPGICTPSMASVDDLQEYASSLKQDKRGTGNFDRKNFPLLRSMPKDDGQSSVSSRDEETPLSGSCSPGDAMSDVALGAGLLSQEASIPTEREGFARMEEALSSLLAAIRSCPKDGPARQLLVSRAYEVEEELDAIQRVLEFHLQTVHVTAPAGANLGLVLDDPPDEGPVYVQGLHERSPLKDEIRLNDRIIAIDGKDVRQMGSEDVCKLLRIGGNAAERRISIVRDRDAPAGLDKELELLALPTTRFWLFLSDILEAGACGVEI